MSVMSNVLVVRDPADVTARAGPVTWALSQLRDALAARGVACDEMPAGEGVRLVAATPASALAQEMLKAAGVSLPAVAEALAVIPGKHGGQSAVLACGTDGRGLVYAVAVNLLLDKTTGTFLDTDADSLIMTWPSYWTGKRAGSGNNRLHEKQSAAAARRPQRRE